MILKEKYPLHNRQLFTLCVFALCVIAAIVLRIKLYHTITSDYLAYVGKWYDYIKANGGFAAFKDNFYNYNPPYPYLLAIATYLPIGKLVAIKSISIIFDGVLAVFTYLIIQLKYRRTLPALLGVLAILFAPTIFINSAAWGQCDATYTAFCLGSLYFLLKDKAGWACAFFGIAIAFKLQAIFFLPVLLLLLYKKRLPFGYLALIPLIFAISLIPTLIAGRGIGSLLNIYVQQAQSGGVSRENLVGRDSLTYGAPTIYQWLLADNTLYWKGIGCGLAGLFVIGVTVLVHSSKQRITAETMLKIALVFVLSIPFFLPEMHERYFYPADAFSIVFAFYFPSLFFIPLIMQLSSLSSYSPYLWGHEVISLTVVAGGLLLMIIVTLIDLTMTLYPTFRRLIVPPKDRTDTETPIQSQPPLSEEPQWA
jgi:Predicted integral membrane protein